MLQIARDVVNGSNLRDCRHSLVPAAWSTVHVTRDTLIVTDRRFAAADAQASR